MPAVACFDTAFHATIPAAAATFALPEEWRTRWSLRRFGFHGLSHAYVSRRAAELLGRDGDGTAAGHLPSRRGRVPGRGQGGRSVDTTMGFTPLDGLVMATRSGSVDPGLVLWLEEHVHMPPAELAAALEHRSGLYGLAGTADMREILSRAAAGDARAELARETYLHRLRASIAAAWPRRWTDSTRSCSPAASGRTRPRSASAPWTASVSSASPSTPSVTTRVPGTARSARPAPGARPGHRRPRGHRDRATGASGPAFAPLAAVDGGVTRGPRTCNHDRPADG